MDLLGSSYPRSRFEALGRFYLRPLNRNLRKSPESRFLPPGAILIAPLFSSSSPPFTSVPHPSWSLFPGALENELLKTAVLINHCYSRLRYLTSVMDRKKGCIASESTSKDAEERPLMEKRGTLEPYTLPLRLRRKKVRRLGVLESLIALATAIVAFITALVQYRSTQQTYLQVHNQVKKKRKRGAACNHKHRSGV